MSDFQFYPTPLSLAKKAWAMFKNKDFNRILDTSAGNGDLLKGSPRFDSTYGSGLTIDCCEIDMSKHATLRSLPGVTVVGMDYFTFGGGSMYSHVIQNPPFNKGVHFVLRAWESMFDGEIVSIINAETVRNPNSRERQHLLSLIERFGEVEFVEQAFVGDDVQRETNVEVALVYLRKKSEIGEDIVASLLDDLKGEDASAQADRFSAEYKESQELAVPTTVIENFVLAFNSAVKTMRESVLAEARANHFSSMLGETMAALTAATKIETAKAHSVTWVRGQMASRYMTLKDKAWANLLRSSNIESQLSSGAKKRMEAAFDEIKTLEFTSVNICGFLRGLAENQGTIMRQMAVDIFDLVTRYHSENVCFYKGWKSNDKQRTCGMRLKKSRFVIPGNLNWAGSSHLSCDAERRLADFDRVFAMLDGKELPEVSLSWAFRNHMSDLRTGKRVSTSYFDVRFYPGAGTIHFFPRSQELMDKLNRLVGEYRKWLPPQTETPSKEFMRQYNDADRFDKELRAAVEEELRGRGVATRYQMQWDNPMRRIFSDGDEGVRASEVIDSALSKVHEHHGFSVDFQLQHSKTADTQEQLLLLAA